MMPPFVKSTMSPTLTLTEAGTNFRLSVSFTLAAAVPLLTATRPGPRTWSRTEELPAAAGGVLPPPGKLPAAAGGVLPLPGKLPGAAGELLPWLPPPDELPAPAGEPPLQAVSTSTREVPAQSRMLRILVIDLISSRVAAAPAILGYGPRPLCCCWESAGCAHPTRPGRRGCSLQLPASPPARRSRRARDRYTGLRCSLCAGRARSEVKCSRSSTNSEELANASIAEADSHREIATRASPSWSDSHTCAPKQPSAAAALDATLRIASSSASPCPGPG